MDENNHQYSRALLQKAFTGASVLVGIQVGSRLLTFILNLALARSMQDPSVLGIANVQLYLLDALVLGTFLVWTLLSITD